MDYAFVDVNISALCNVTMSHELLATQRMREIELLILGWIRTFPG